MAGLRSIGALVLLTGLLASCGHSRATPPPIKPVPKTAVAAKLAEPSKGRVATIDMAALFSLQQDGKALIYDVRPSFVNAFGHLPGAINWPRGAFDTDLARHEPEIKAALAADKNVIFYCTDAACPDSRAVAARIAEKGYSVSVLAGGYNTWKDAGMPVE